MQIFGYVLLAFALQMARCEGGTEVEPILECLKQSDPMGATYRGTTSETKNGIECQRWDTDEPHWIWRFDRPDDRNNNYCRNPDPDEENSVMPWCYTIDPDVRWEYCSIKVCAGPCNGMMDENKCFVAITYKDPSVGFDNNGAVEECRLIGGSPAAFHSQQQMDDIMNYIRNQTWFNGNMNFRTGLNFDPLANELTFRNGAAAPDELKWRPGSPVTGKQFYDATNVLLSVNRDPSSRYQYLTTTLAKYLTNVLCEIE